jgi:hypothetical protein
MPGNILRCPGAGGGLLEFDLLFEILIHNLTVPGDTGAIFLTSVTYNLLKRLDSEK